MGYITATIGIILAVFCGMIFIALGMDFAKSMQYGIGTVSQDREITIIKELKKEEGGCVYFLDVWGSEGKICGSYSIKIYTEE